jgi:hypothetical protein
VQPMKGWAVFGVAMLVFAGCGGGDNAAPATSAVAVTTSVAETTPATTTPSPTSTSTTVAATTTLPATTTTVATEDLIKQAVQDYIGSYEQCGTLPATCDPATFTAVQGPSRAILSEFATAMVSEGLHFSTDRRGTYLVAESISSVSSTEASANYCWYDSLIVLGPIGPDGAPTVVNDTIASVRYTYGMFLEDGVWLVGRQHELERLGEGSLCPPSE